MTSNGKAVKTVPIELGGETRRMKLDLNAIIEFEERTGIDIMEAGDKFGDLNVRHVRTLLHVLLQSGTEEEITEEDVGSWVDISNLDYITEKIGELMDDSLPDKEKETEGNPSPAPAESVSTG